MVNPVKINYFFHFIYSKFFEEMDSAVFIFRELKTDARTGSVYASVPLTLSVNIIFTALGLRPQTPADAPPLAGFSMKSPVAYNHNTPYLHDIKILITTKQSSFSPRSGYDKL